MENKLIYDERIKNSLSFNSYVEMTEKFIGGTDVNNLNEEEFEKYNYIKFILQRNKRRN